MGVAGNILTVADDLLKNDGQKFLEMMEQLAEHRTNREEEAAESVGAEEDDDDEEDEEDDEGDEDYDDDLDKVRCRFDFLFFRWVGWTRAGLQVVCTCSCAHRPRIRMDHVWVFLMEDLINWPNELEGRHTMHGLGGCQTSPFTSLNLSMTTGILAMSFLNSAFMLLLHLTNHSTYSYPP